MKNPFLRRIGSLFIAALLGFFLIQNPFSEQYAEKLRADAIGVSLQKDALYWEIIERMDDYEKPPSDAKIDKVWKKMPGYNGIRVNVEASYKKMRKEGKFEENHLVFEQVPPAVHLEDLPPAPIYRGHPEKPMVSFAINVAWGGEYLSPMLKTMKAHEVKATFFLEGRWTKENPELAALLAEEGHEIGNHSYSHPDLRKLPRAETERELKMANDIIEAATGIRPKWFAPPSGSYSDETVAVAAGLGMETVLWTVDTIDWKKPSPAVLQNRVLRQIHNGAIILMHPTASTSAALDELISSIQKKGYRIGTLSQLMDEKRLPES